MKMSKKFDNFMAAEYTIVFALGLSTISAIVTHTLGLHAFSLKAYIFETIVALCVAWTCVCVFPIFQIGNCLATSIFKKQPPSQAYMFFMSAGICAVIIPCVCLTMCTLITGYPAGMNMRIVWSGFLMFAAPMYILAIVLVQILGKPLFKIAIKILGDEAFEKEEEQATTVVEEEPEEEKDLSIEPGGAMHGEWEVVNNSPVGKNTLLYHIEQRGEKIYGTIDYEGKTAKIREGSFKDGKFDFMVTLQLPFGAMKTKMSGMIDGANLKGTSLMDGRTTDLNGVKK